MRVWVVAALFAWVVGVAAAQERAWVQIEAQPTLAEAQARARAYAAAFPDVAGFRVGSGWYAIVLGPYSPEAAALRLRELLTGNLVPGDSFVSRGEVYRDPFWPVGADPAAAPVQQAALPEIAVAAPEPAPAPAAEPEPPPEPDETVAEARRSEAELDRDARKELQAALQWSGFYDGGIDGAIGPGTRAAMEAWQADRGFPATGVLTTRQRADLLGERARIEAELGLQTITEREAGIEVALPMAMVEFEGYDPPFVLYRAKGGSGLRVILLSQPGDAGALRGLYDILQTLDTVPADGPRELLDRSFTLEGANGTTSAYATAEVTQGLVKGWMLVWEPAAAPRIEAVKKAMRATFRPVGARALDPGLVPLDDASRAGLLAGMEVRRPERSRSGLFVAADGTVLTVAEAVQGCGRVTIDRDTEADVVLADAAAGLAVLRPRAALAPRALAGFEPGVVRPGAEVAVAGYSYEDALPAPALTFGTVAAATGLEGEPGLRRLSIATLPGDAGGPVLDSSGALVGMLLPRAEAGARVLPEGVAFAAGAPELAARLAAAGVAVRDAVRDGALSPEDLTKRATAMTVLVSCWN
jgi:peptidoglycan hydrolase-like protein with peptidoglycan-binding domain